jgi:hypothetical protein
MDDPFSSSNDAELERIAFGPGHTPEEVLAASAVLRERIAAREEAARAEAARAAARAEAARADAARAEVTATADGDAAPAESGHPPRTLSDRPEAAPGSAAEAPRSRRTLIGGAVLLAVVCAGAGYAAGASRTPAADPAADRGTERTGELGLYAELADPVAAAAPLFETEEDDDDVLAAPVATIDPTSVRAVARTGNARFWVARDYDGGYCLVFARYRDDEVIGQEPFCATAEQFAESGNHVALNGYRVDWTGGEVEIGVTTN